MTFCTCRQWPACQPHEHPKIEQSINTRCAEHGHITFGVPQGFNGPPCIWCNAPTKRTGTCWTCIACGSTTSC